MLGIHGQTEKRAHRNGFGSRNVELSYKDRKLQVNEEETSV